MFKDAQIQQILEEHRPSNISDLNRMLKGFSKQLIEALLEKEMTEHLGKKKYERIESDNNRNGHTPKRLKSSFGDMGIKTPRDRLSSFEPIFIKKGAKNIGDIEEKILYMYGRGMSERDIANYLKEIYGYSFSAQSVSNIVDEVTLLVKSWQNRPLDKIYPMIFLDAVVFKVRRDGIVKNTAVYSMQGVNLDGKKDILGLWIGENETSKYWLQVLNEIKNRGVEDILILCTDNLSGLTDAINATFPNSDIQKCIVHQIRNSLKFVSYKDRKLAATDLKTIYKANTEKEGKENLSHFAAKWDKQYPYISKSWYDNWEELSTFFKYPKEVRRIIYTTNTIESYHRSLRKVTKTKTSFPNEESLMKLLFLITRNITKKWTNPIRNWGMIYSQLQIFYKERLDKYS